MNRKDAKIGMKVRMNNKDNHKEYSEYYSVKGVIGKIIRLCYDTCVVEWPNGTVDYPYTWYCEYESLDIVNGDDIMTDDEIWNMLKCKMDKNGVKSDWPSIEINNKIFYTPFYSKYMLIKAVSLAYRVGHARGSKGRPFKYGDKK